MPKYLIDVNLPYRFKPWQTEEFIHAKDADFSNRMLSVSPPPKVIHIRFGNLKMKQFAEVITKFWLQATEMIAISKMIYIYKDRIESIQ